MQAIRHILILSVLVGLAMPAIAWGDFSFAPIISVNLTKAHKQEVFTTEQVSKSISLPIRLPIQRFAVPRPANPLEDWSSDSPCETTFQDLREFPPLPGSASLFLSAALSVGAWQLVRSASRFNLNGLPEWYHPDGPAQLGHTVLFDLQFAPQGTCPFDAPVKFKQDDHVSYCRQIEKRSRIDHQYFLIITDPRGPPAFS